MRALVTGAHGFVGPYLTSHLVSKGDEVVGVDQEMDITDAEGVRRRFADEMPDVVYHLAAASHVGDSWSAPAQVVRINSEGTLNVLLAAVEAGVERVVLIGSAEEYGHVTPDRLPIDEQTPLLPVSPYGASKASAEMLASYVVRGRDLPVVMVRPFNHLGPGQSDRLVASSLAQQVAQNELDGGGEVLAGDLSPQRDFSDVRDVVRAYRLLAERGVPGEAYNVCSGVAVAIRDLADMLISLSETPMKVVLDPDRLRPVDVAVLQGDNTKLREATGWTPEIPLEQTLSDILDWWRAKLAN
ncbi:MAG: GDP-4-dehydro-6-deoxy-D-mannose reductase [Actinomycetota bacterium]|nr:GDP-4-dehydro-6-deoxy-D-mannose reductase [Actinomycetota bacterium]